MTSTPRTMQAMRAAGQDPASLARQTIPVPEPEPGEVLVAVRATAITADELTWPESWPAIPCHDLSGVVVGSRSRRGPGKRGRRGLRADRLRPARRRGRVRNRARRADLAAKPSGVDHLAAAAVPLGALTAWQALYSPRPACRPGQHVLIHGGAGGVGAYAVQLARRSLRRSGHRHRVGPQSRLVAALGADQVLDYSGRFEDHRLVTWTSSWWTRWAAKTTGPILAGAAQRRDPGRHRRGTGTRPIGGRSDAVGVFFVVEPHAGQLRRNRPWPASMTSSCVPWSRASSS